jgi:hypothetical protein
MTDTRTYQADAIAKALYPAPRTDNKEIDMKTFAQTTPKPAMNPIDLRTQLEDIEAQLKRANTDEERRSLNAKRRTIEKKMLKVQKREVHQDRRAVKGI